MTGSDSKRAEQTSPDALAQADGGGERDEEAQRYLVLWGDAVAPKQLGVSIALTVTVALAVFLLARHGFSALGAEKIVDGYALLAGLVTCVAAGAVCARLFKPKRVFAEASFDDDRHNLLAELSSPQATAGVPAEYIDEMRELGLFEYPAETRATGGGTRGGIER